MGLVQGSFEAISTRVRDWERSPRSNRVCQRSEQHLQASRGLGQSIRPPYLPEEWVLVVGISIHTAICGLLISLLGINALFGPLLVPLPIPDPCLELELWLFYFEVLFSARRIHIPSRSRFVSEHLKRVFLEPGQLPNFRFPSERNV